MAKLLILLLLAVLGAGAFWFFALQEDSAPGLAESEVSTPPPAPQSHTVVYTNQGYIPNSLNVRSGDFVRWRNESSQDMWTASAVHPAHEAYPGSSRADCGKGLDMFDQCEGAGAGETWTFQFEEAGAWRYHNHLLPSHTGGITVEE